MGLTFRTKLLASHVALVAAVVLLAILELNRSLGADLERQLDARLEEQARGAASWVGEGGRKHPDKIAGRIAAVVHADVTIFDKDGAVAGESAPSAPRTYGDRSEIDAARRGDIGRATRAVGGSGDEMHYVAINTGDGWVLRLGAPLSGINATVRAMRSRLFAASGLALLAAIALGFFASRVAAGPLRAMTDSATRIAKGDYDIDVPATSPDEFGVLARALGSLAAQLKDKIDDLTAERDRLSAILAGMAEGVLVVGAGGTVVLANPAAAAVLDTTSLQGKPLREAIADDALRAFVEGAPGEGELESRGKSLAVYVRPLAGSGGGVVAVLRDMTRLRKLLTIQRDFVANVSHELRTPVTSIQGYAETLLRGTTDPATSKQFLEIVHRQARRIAALVEELLTLAEIEARPQEKRAGEPVDLGAIARDVAAMLRERATHARADVRVTIAEGTTALGDATGLERVVSNLVDNAIKYGRAGGTVTIEAEARGADVVLTVRDDGPGIAAEHLPRVFERFYRVDAGRSREKGGSGLGLAIARHLVEAMGGTIEVASEPGEGTRFTVTLPRGPREQV